MSKLREFWGKRMFRMAMLLSVALLLAFGSPSLASQSETVHRYKLLSTLEYSGQSQFSNEFETIYTVKKLASSDDKLQFCLSASDVDSLGNKMNAGEQTSLKELSFVIDGKTQQLSATVDELAFLEKVSNQCVKSLSRVTKSNVGKTWKQSFDLSSLGDSVPHEVRFTLTAIQLKTDTLGETIAVRALSEPFSVKIAREEGGIGTLQCKINCVYVFDRSFEDIHLSVSVFRTMTNVNGFNEVLQHTIATCKADAEGKSLDLSDLDKDKDFKKLVTKIGVTDSLKVVKNGPLPQWARADGVRAAQVATICAAASCEGALNPVATVFLPASRAVELQSSREPITRSAQLARSGGGGSGNTFGWFGWNFQTAAWVTGVTFGTLGAAGAFDETKTEYRSP
jgi:hypothetical protein